MGTYIARRLLLMIPTLLGITFLVFMLVALSPGGIGAALRMQTGQMDATSAAMQQAYLDDRYGLDAPAAVQYVRWLGRISPLKFGQRDQIALTGERISPPKALSEPPLWHWITADLPRAVSAPPHLWPQEATADHKSSVYRRAANIYASARVQYIGSRALYEQAVANYARAQDLGHAVDRGGDKVREHRLRHVQPDREAPQWAEVERRGAVMIAAYANALEQRERVVAIFKARPYPEAGFWIVPGVASLAQPDLGRSFSRSRPVADLIKEALPVTLMLNLIAFPIIYLIAIPTGMLSATHRGSWFDVLTGSLFIALWSFPIVLAGVLAIGFLANKQYLGWFPVSGIHASGADMFTFLPSVNADGQWHRGYLLDTLWHVALPVACLVYGGFAVLAKQTRAAMLDNFNADYVRTAKAKGVANKDVVLRHVFRNSLLPLITMFVTIFPAMLSGAVVIEKIFTIPGMGSLAINAINLRDREVILATTLMIAGVNLLALLLADILYALADPRISYE
jgi:ABC-type dipeptide/oligopeptide/nickel transport system permease component